MKDYLYEDFGIFQENLNSSILPFVKDKRHVLFLSRFVCMDFCRKKL